MQPKNFPLLDLYLELSNDIDMSIYKNLFDEFVELWGVDIHFFVDKMSEYKNLDELLLILKNSQLNTFSFNDGIFNNKFNKSPVDIIEKCAKYGANSLVIPIDLNAIYNRQYTEYVEQIKNIIKFEVYFKIDNMNSKSFEDIIKFCIEKNIKLCILDIDKSVDNKNRIYGTEYGEIVNKVIKINSQKKIRISIAECPYLNAILDGVLPVTLGGCSGGLTSCFIMGNGDVVPCIYLKDINLGNIKERRLRTIWQETPLLLNLRNRNNLQGKCRKCKYLLNCGGCRAESYYKYNNLFYEDNNCWISKEGG